jgi:glutamate-1-semialdehyde 2,1-aminomutase
MSGVLNAERAPRSVELLNAAGLVVPGGVNTCRRKIDPPFCVARARGAHIQDMDGRWYIDYHAAYGAVLLGHGYAAVDQPVKAAIDDGILFGVGITEAELLVAQQIVTHIPSVDQVLLCNSGSEATLHAIRVSRAATGREKVLKFQGCYHGTHDYVLRNVISPRELIGRRDPGSAGMLASAVDNTLVCRFNDLEDVESKLRANAEQIAAVIIEPIAHNAPSILPRDGFLAGLRKLCNEHGAILIFDELITGIRHSLGGYQATCHVLPDLTCLGKALGNGYPVAAIGGRRDLMQRFNTTPDGDVHFGGTFSGNRVGAVAAAATISEIEERDVYGHLFELGARMRDGLASIADELGVPAVVSGYGSVYALSFMSGELRSYEDALRSDTQLQARYRRELIERGVFEMPESHGRNHISYSHTTDDIDLTLTAAREALRSAINSRR